MLTFHGILRRRMAGTCQAGTSAEKLLARASHTHSEGWLTAERCTACNTIRYVEIAQLSHTRSTDVIVHLKSIFACHGIPEVLMSDNGPQFSGQAFTNFAASYGFRLITSSLRFPQSNGEAERAVQTVKNLLKKAKAPICLYSLTEPLLSRVVTARRSSSWANVFTPRANFFLPA